MVMKKRSFVIVAGGIGLALVVFGVWVSQQYVVPILMYHHVAVADPKEANWVTPENFARQMAYLKEHGYNVIALADLIERMRAGKDFPRNTVVITFDDGYDNNYYHAFPVLKRFGFPATIFMVADFVDQPGFLTLAQMQEMQTQGITFGSHSRRHAYLPDVSPEVLRDEVVNSKKILEELLNRPIDLMGYPSGGYNAEVQQVVREAGYRGACTTNRGFSRQNEDLYALKRVRFVNRSTDWPINWMQLSGYYNLFRSPKNPD